MILKCNIEYLSKPSPLSPVNVCLTHFSSAMNATHFTCLLIMQITQIEIQESQRNKNAKFFVINSRTRAPCFKLRVCLMVSWRAIYSSCNPWRLTLSIARKKGSFTDPFTCTGGFVRISYT